METLQTDLPIQGRDYCTSVRREGRSIVVARLEEVDALLTHEIHNSVLLGEPARPGARGHVLEGFGLADTLEWVSKDCLNDI